jgi:hypothetical protein
MLSANGSARSIDWGRFALVGLATVIAAVAANVLVYFIGSALVGYDPQFVVLANVSATILFTVVPAIVAVLLYALLLRFTDNPTRRHHLHPDRPRGLHWANRDSDGDACGRRGRHRLDADNAHAPAIRVTCHGGGLGTSDCS